MNFNSQQIIELAQRTLQVEAEALNVMAANLGEEFLSAVDAVLACSGKLIITGMGKSGLVGRKIAATLASTGTPSFYSLSGRAFRSLKVSRKVSTRMLL